MMGLDSYNNLDQWPLDGIDDFIEACLSRGVDEINITGSNTDPLLYRHTPALTQYLRKALPDITLGLRTNGVLTYGHEGKWACYDKGSVSVTSLYDETYRATMGRGKPPNFSMILDVSPFLPKVNIVLCPETCTDPENLLETIMGLNGWGIEEINLREPYGQPHIGDPMPWLGFGQEDVLFGMPVYNYQGTNITYWDVHYVEVDSINLYASGRVSLTYPVSKGHCPVVGAVWDQRHFPRSGRIQEQWLQNEVR